MSRLVRTELRKLRTIRSVPLLGLGALAVAALLGMAGASIAGEGDSAALGTSSMIANLVGASALPALVALLVGVVCAAGEYQHRTILLTFLVTPDRRRVVVAKAWAAAIVGAASAVAMAGASLGAATPALLDADRVDVLDGEVAAAILGSATAAALLGIAGVAIGLTIRSQVGAIVAVGAWFVVVEAIGGTLLGPDVARWLPAAAAGELAASSDRIGMPVAACVLGAWCLAALGASAVAVTRRDVT